MRIAVTLICAALTVSHANADPLSAAVREALLDSLEALRDSAGEKVDARFRPAISAYRQAMGSNETAIEFYLKKKWIDRKGRCRACNCTVATHHGQSNQ